VAAEETFLGGHIQVPVQENARRENVFMLTLFR